ncbi:hypothetical protein MHYP_G00243110 [Metynnis hypsauchen]
MPTRDKSGLQFTPSSSYLKNGPLYFGCRRPGRFLSVLIVEGQRGGRVNGVQIAEIFLRSTSWEGRGRSGL